MRYLRSQKGLRLPMIIGLLITLLTGVVVLIMYLFHNNKANLINRGTIFLSKYRSLSPYILAQARLESGNFTSNIYRNTNNAFGMNHPVKRPSLGYKSNVFENNSTNPMQGYRNDTQSFRDLFLWFDYGRFPTKVQNAESYVRELKIRGYFTAKESDYLKGLNSYL